MNRSFFLSLGAGCALTLLVTVAYLAEWPPLERLEAKAYDGMASLFARETSSPVVAVVMDRQSLSRIGSWPWPCAYVGVALSRLRDSGARVIGLDLLYSGKDPNPGLREIRRIMRKFPNDRRLLKEYGMTGIFSALKEAEKKLDNDTLLASSLSSADDVVLPLRFYFAGEENSREPEPSLLRNSLKSTFNYSVAARRVETPIYEFLEGGAALGHINRQTDPDGAARSDSLLIPYRQRLYPSFSLRLALLYLKIPAKDLLVGKEALRIGKMSIPLHDGLKMFIRFSEKSSLPAYSFADVVSGKIEPSVFRDKIVIIGPVEPGIASFVKTSLNTEIPQLFYYGAAVSTILGNTAVARPSWALYLETGALVVFGSLVSLLLPRLSSLAAALFSAGATAAWIGLELYLFSAGYLIKASCPALLMTVGGAGVLMIRFFQSGKEEEPMESDIVETEEFRLETSGRTDTGRVRESNEDSFCVDRQAGLIAVADGVGGQASGEVASRMAIDKMREYFRTAREGTVHASGSGSDYSQAAISLGNAVHYANRAIYEASVGADRLRGMGSTIAAVLVRGSGISVAHVGDSRVYLGRAGQFEPLTEDHALKARGLKHVLTRALGAGPKVEVDLSELTLADGDIVLLCSDGLNAMLPDSEIFAAVQSLKDPFRACTRLVVRANERGGRDNVTVVTAYVHRKK